VFKWPEHALKPARNKRSSQPEYALGHRPDTLMEADSCGFAMPEWKIGADLNRLLAERATR
jgi:hypothetical protein